MFELKTILLRIKLSQSDALRRATASATSARSEFSSKGGKRDLTHDLPTSGRRGG